MTIRLYRYANFQYQSWFKFHVFDRKGAKEHQKGFRAWLAWSFRRLADRIDGAKSMSVDIQSTPSLSEQQKNHVMNCGLNLANSLFQELVEAEALEEGMREALPELYRDREDSCKTKP